MSERRIFDGWSVDRMRRALYRIDSATARVTSPVEEQARRDLIDAIRARSEEPYQRKEPLEARQLTEERDFWGRVSAARHALAKGGMKPQPGEIWEDAHGKRIELLVETQAFPAWWLVRPLDGSGDHKLSEWAIVQGKRSA